ncbi:MAG: hypothetical protein LPK11_08460 [Chromatiaceae bacterium]|nr:hypothetical protein [Chromatiaceae bacterium]
MKKFTRTNNARFIKGVLATTLAMFLGHNAIADDFGIMPPSYNLIDRHSVNVATNQVQLRLEDVKIGGSKGLRDYKIFCVSGCLS